MGWMLWPAGIGWRARGRTVQNGTFECRNPGCKGKRTSATQQYRLKRHRNWAVLFYVPVLPLNNLGVNVQCASCKTHFSLDVLPEHELRALADSISRPNPATAIDGVRGKTGAIEVDVPMRQCDNCGQQAPCDVASCPHCAAEVEPWRFHEGRWWVERAEGWYSLDAGANRWNKYEAPASSTDVDTVVSKSEVARSRLSKPERHDPEPEPVGAAPTTADHAGPLNSRVDTGRDTDAGHGAATPTAAVEDEPRALGASPALGDAEDARGDWECSSCGATNVAPDRFCTSCGAA